jgi:hypothetical protein
MHGIHNKYKPLLGLFLSGISLDIGMGIFQRSVVLLVVRVWNMQRLIYSNVGSNAIKVPEIFVNLNLNEIIMKSVNVQLSDFEFNQLGLNKNTLSFSELLEIIGKKITKQTLEKSIQLANKYGLSKMTMDEIDDEIKAHRNAKNNS